MGQDRPAQDEIAFVVEPDFETGAFVAFWDDPSGGGITTQASTLEELAAAIKEAVQCHFAGGPLPLRASLNFAQTELQLA